MPTYEYICEKCGGCFERYQQITARPLRKCPSCGGRVRRKISAGGGVIFKGSGFYETDYKRKGHPPAKDHAAREKEGAGDEKAAPEKKESDKKDS